MNEGPESTKTKPDEAMDADEAVDAGVEPVEGDGGPQSTLDAEAQNPPAQESEPPDQSVSARNIFAFRMVDPPVSDSDADLQ